MANHCYNKTTLPFSTQNVRSIHFRRCLRCCRLLSFVVVGLEHTHTHTPKLRIHTHTQPPIHNAVCCCLPVCAHFWGLQGLVCGEHPFCTTTVGGGGTSFFFFLGCFAVLFRYMEGVYDNFSQTHNHNIILSCLRIYIYIYIDTYIHLYSRSHIHN